MPNPYPINPILKLVVKVWMFFFTWYYRISFNIPKELKSFNHSYLMLSNHYGRYDPFIISYPFKNRPNFISSDSIFRDKLIGYLFRGLGAMPKKKGVRDTYIIREMVKVIRSGRSLALFPEGARSWNGETNYIDGSIAKLIKLLNVPVITVRMKGAYGLDPRWAMPLRKAKVDIDYQLGFTRKQIAELTEDEIMSRLRNYLYQDDITYLKENKIKINSSRRAEFIDLTLFQCPVCEKFAGFNAKGNHFICRSCGVEYRVTSFGMIERKDGITSRFESLKDWVNWQNVNFVKDLKKQLARGVKDSLFSAENILVYYARGYDILQPIGMGKISFYPDKLKISVDGKDTDLSWTQIQAIGPQHLERIELLHGDEAYRFTSSGNKEAGLKWEIAANVVWYHIGQVHKLSHYFKDLVT